LRDTENHGVAGIELPGVLRNDCILIVNRIVLAGAALGTTFGTTEAEISEEGAVSDAQQSI
jgi:hypothetical protein